MKKLLRKSMQFLATFGIVVTAAAANSTCLLFAHQPEMPEGYKSLRKF